MRNEQIEIFYPTSPAAWRTWLEEKHHSEQAVWLIFYRKRSGIKSITWNEAVEVALCFGWIDSKKVKIDEESSRQFFSKRKAKSTWSKINKAKVQQLIDSGLMTQAGLDSIEIAKQNGSWTILDEVEELIIPKDLEKGFETKRGSKDFFLSLSKTDRKSILHWVVFAKRPETREKRIAEIVMQAAQQRKPKHLQ